MIIFTILANAFITLYMYFQLYFWHFLLFVLCMVCVVLEYKEKGFLYVDDQRKVV